MARCLSGLVAFSDAFKAVTVGRDVVVYHVKDQPENRVIRPRRFQHHQADIVSLLLHPGDKHCLFSAGADGMILKWNALTFEIISRYEVGRPMQQLAVVQASDAATLYAVVSTHVDLFITPLDTSGTLLQQTLVEVSDKPKWKCLVCKRENAQTAFKCGKKACPGQAPFVLPAITNFAAAGKYAAVAHKRSILVCTLFDKDPDGERLRWRFKVGTNATALTIDPTSPTLAIGDEAGPVVLLRWNAAQPGSTEINCATHHWHSSPVRNLLWSTDGALILSSAQEGALCTWKPRLNMERFVLPRLGNIVSIACDEQSFTYLVTTEPNQLHTIDALNKRVTETKTDINFSQIATFYDNMTVCNDFHSVAIFGKPNTVSFHNPTFGISVGALTVQPMNYICQLKGEEPVQSKVKHLKFSHDGVWMATMNQTDSKLTADIFVGVLRFWKSVSESAERYICNTVVYQPHDGEVTQMAYHGSLDLLVTAGTDRSIKLWGFQGKQKNSFWSCIRTILKPSLFPHAVCFSNEPAGSLVLVAHDNLVTMWRSDDLSCPNEGAELTQSVDQAPLRSVHMLSNGRNVVAHSENHIFVWDIFHRILLWAVKLPVLEIVPLLKTKFHGSAATFAVLTSGRIVEFTNESSLPSFLSPPNLAPAALKKVVVVKDAHKRPYYVLLDAIGCLRSYLPPVGSSSVLAAKDDKPVTPNEEKPGPLPTPASDPQKKELPSTIPSQAIPVVLKRTVERCNFLFLGDTHVIPPVHTMYDKFMDNFLAPTQASS